MTSIFVAEATALARIPLGAETTSTGGTEDALLREALLLANRHGAAVWDPAPQDAATASTQRGYEIRLRSRTTPLGVFAGVAPVHFGEGAAVLRLGSQQRVRTMPSAAWLAAVADHALHEPGVLARITLYTSNLLRRHGQRYHCERPGGLTGEGPRATTVRATPVTSFIIDAARGGAEAAGLIEAVHKQWPQAPAAVIEQTLISLIRAGVLLHDLLPPDPREDSPGHLLKALPAASPLRRDLAALRGLLADADRYPPGDTARWHALTSARDLADRVQPCERPLRADTAMDAILELPVSLARQAAEAADLLWRIGWGSPPLREYHDRFRQRYGVNRAVPLLEATDPVIGIGCPAGATDIGPAEPDPRREAVLARLLAEATAHGRTEITLTPDVIAELQAPAGDVPPRTAEIYVRLCGDSLGRERMTLALCPGGGSQDAGSTAGRFARLLPGLFNTAGTSSDDSAVLAELVVQSRTFDTATVAAETGFAAHRIPLGVPSRPGDLLPEDLHLFSNGRHLTVWSATLQRPVTAVMYSRLTPDLLPPLGRLLSLIGHGDTRPWHGWSWRHNPPFQPAVRYRRVLLAPARWLLPSSLQAAVNAGLSWHAALAAWRTQTRPAPPRIVVTDDGDRQLPLDLDQFLDRELLRRYTRRGLQAVTAPLAADSPAPLPGPGGHHVVDLAISLRRTTPAPAAYNWAPSPPRPSGTGRHLPGSRWLSLSVRAPAAHHDAILTTLPHVATDTAAHWDRFFWLRYHDHAHGPHLRIRFNGQPALLGSHLLPALSEWGELLYNQRLSAGFSIDPYEQESERYGGPDAITVAEDVFCTDSALTLSALGHTAESNERLVIAALSAAAIARHVADDPVAAVSRPRLERPARRHAAALRPQARAADHLMTPQLPDALRHMWDDRNRALAAYRHVLPAHRRAACASDLIHLHCNRLVPGAESELLVRDLAADLLATQTHHVSAYRNGPS